MPELVLRLMPSIFVAEVCTICSASRVPSSSSFSGRCSHSRTVLVAHRMRARWTAKDSAKLREPSSSCLVQMAPMNGHICVPSFVSTAQALTSLVDLHCWSAHYTVIHRQVVL